MKLKKKVIIELEIDAESSGGLDGKRLEQAVEKDLPFTVETVGKNLTKSTSSR